jgi:hypothetical protein
MKKTIKLTESDLTRIVRQILKEEECLSPPEWLMNFKIDGKLGKSDCTNWNWRASDYLFVWISLKDNLLSVTTATDLDETSKEAITTAMGSQPKTKSTTLSWTKNFTSSEEGGDLNTVLNGLQGHIPWISTLQEAYRRLTESIMRNKMHKRFR